MDILDENRVWEIAEIASQQQGAPHIAYVASVNPADHTLKVNRYFGDGEPVLSDDIPMTRSGSRYIPKIGEAAFVIPELHDASSLMLSGFIYDDDNKPPLTLSGIDGQTSHPQPGEHELIGPTGANLRLNADGSIFLGATSGFNIQSPINTKGDISTDGNGNVTKNFTVGNGATGTFTSADNKTITVTAGIITDIT